MPQNRMNREEFFAKLAPLDAEQRGKILWNLYWRGTAAVRERIEGELDPPERERRKRDAATPPDPVHVLAEVSQFVEQARSGAYIAGDRRVSRTERTKWRVTFRQLATDAQLTLHAEDTAPGEQAIELMIDLARHAEGSFRSEDPLEAAKFVLSHAVSALWETLLAEYGERTRNLARWNELLSGHLDAERAERLANHPAFEGPDADFMRARAARRRGDIDAARTLIGTCLERLPGRQEFADFAEEVGADLPPRAREMRAERAAVQARLARAYQGGPVSSD